ncbi:MAG TPA: hypothetical protein VK674_02565 [Candidatus Limnocylindria bacterium]|nr:hypothetical protein [Candidatus Limnocylindria bacterium]
MILSKAERDSRISDFLNRKFKEFNMGTTEPASSTGFGIGRSPNASRG